MKTPTSKGKNIHVIAGISQTGLIYWERRRGSYKKENCNEWVRKLVRQVTEPMERVVVVVCDNAPVHVNLETVVQEDEFQGACILRLAPYSAPLNPIEECCSVFKKELRKLFNNTQDELLRVYKTSYQTK